MDNSSDDSESGNSEATDAAAAGDDALTDDSGKSSEDLMAHIKDRLRAIAEGDRTAYAETIEASGRHITQQELDDFDSRGGAPLVAAMRQHEFLLGDVAPESALGQRWEQWQMDLRAMDGRRQGRVHPGKPGKRCGAISRGPRGLRSPRRSAGV